MNEESQAASLHDEHREDLTSSPPIRGLVGLIGCTCALLFGWLGASWVATDWQWQDVLNPSSGALLQFLTEVIVFGIAACVGGWVGILSALKASQFIIWQNAARGYRLRHVANCLSSDRRSFNPRALVYLMASRDLRDVEAILGALEHDDLFVRLVAVEVAAHIVYNRGTTALIPLLWLEGDPHTRIAAEEALVTIGFRAVKPLTEELPKVSRADRKAALVRVLGRIGHDLGSEERRRIIRPLVPILKDTLGWENFDESGGHGELGRAVVRALETCGWEPLSNHHRALFAAARKDSDELLSLGPAAVEPLLELARHNSIYGFKMLGEIGDRRAVPLLLDRLPDKDSGFGDCPFGVHGKTVLEALGKIGDPRSFQPLLRAYEATLDSYGSGLHDKDRPLWMPLVLRTLGEVGGSRALDVLRKAVYDSYGAEREAAVKALGDIRDPKALEPLVWALLNGSCTQRQAAARALRLRDWPAAGPWPLPDPNSELGIQEARARIAVALYDWETAKKAGSPAVWPLVETIDDAPPEVRQEAAEVLGKINGLDVLVTALANDEEAQEYKRKLSATALGEIGDARAVEPLIAVLKDGSEDVRLAATRALGQIGDARGVESLTALLRDEDQYVQRAAVGALAEIGDTQALEPLIELFESQDRTLDNPFTGVSLFSLASALGRLGDLRGISVIEELVQDKGYWYFYPHVLEALGRIGSRPAVAHLVKALDEPEDRTRQQAVEWLEKLDWQPTNDPERVAFAIAKEDWDGVVALASEGITSPLIARLKTRDDTLRETVRETLETAGWRPESAEERALLAIARMDWDEAVKLGAVAVDPLLYALKWWNLDLVRDIVDALGATKNTRAVEPLLGVLTDVDTDVSEVSTAGFMGRGSVHTKTIKSIRYHVTTALGEIGDPAAVEPLIQALRDDYYFVKSGAAKALGDIGDLRAVEPLTAALKRPERSEYEDMHSYCEKALEKIQKAQIARRSDATYDTRDSDRKTP